MFVFDDNAKFVNWSKALIYNRDQAQAEFKPTVFEKFQAVSESQRWEELFTASEQDYSYKKIKVLHEANKLYRTKHQWENVDVANDPEFGGMRERSDGVLTESSDDEGPMLETKSGQEVVAKDSVFKKIGGKAKEYFGRPKVKKNVDLVRIFLGLNTETNFRD